MEQYILVSTKKLSKELFKLRWYLRERVALLSLGESHLPAAAALSDQLVADAILLAAA